MSKSGEYGVLLRRAFVGVPDQHATGPRSTGTVGKKSAQPSKPNARCGGGGGHKRPIPLASKLLTPAKGEKTNLPCKRAATSRREGSPPTASPPAGSPPHGSPCSCPPGTCSLSACGRVKREEVEVIPSAVKQTLWDIRSFQPGSLSSRRDGHPQLPAGQTLGQSQQLPAGRS